MVSRGNGDALQRKVGAAVVAVRHAGAIHVFNSINHFFLIAQMIVSGSSYWNIGIGKDPGEVKEDPEGLKTMKDLGGCPRTGIVARKWRAVPNIHGFEAP